MFRMILVPLDGSAFAEQALPHALAIARRTEARLHLVVVRPPLPLLLEGPPAEEYLAGIASRIESQLPGRISHEATGPDIEMPAYPPMPPGSVAEILAQQAEAHDADLIIMTTHGRGGLRRAWLGSAADALMRIAPVPLLLIRPRDESFGTAADADHGLRHILVPLDGSDRAERALQFARAIGEPFGARYTLLRALSPLTWEMSSEWYAAHAPAALVQLTHDSAMTYLEDIARPLREAGIDVDVRVPEAPYPAAAIADYAHEHGVDLIVLSTGGAGGIRRLLVGSVADKVVRSSDSPVLVCNVTHIDEAAAYAHLRHGDDVIRG